MNSKLNGTCIYKSFKPYGTICIFLIVAKSEPQNVLEAITVNGVLCAALYLSGNKI